ncbi:MAG: endonuclease/exonuclease/phosphatase family protein [Vicinamibacterales bacterium]
MTRRRAGLTWIRRLARLIVALVLVGIVVMVAGYRLGPERVWLFAAAQYVPYPVFLVPSVLAIVLSLMLGWGWRFASVAGLVLVLTSVMGVELNRGDQGVRRLRVMTYNIKDYLSIRRPAGLAVITQEIRRHDPDIAVLQDARRLGDSPNALREIFGDRQTFAFGQYVVASRLPMRDCGRREMPFRDEAHTFVSCVVTIDGTDVDLVTAHFVSPRSGLSAAREDPFGAREWRQNVADRLVQAESVAKILAPAQRPTILAGDLNAPDTSIAVRTLLDTGLRDSFSVAGVGLGHTWGHSLRFRLSFVRIDHILVGQEFGVIDSFVGGARGSPHRPVIADLSFSPR